MVTALVLLNAERSKINAVAEKITDMKGVTEVYSVAGQYDLAAVVRVKSNEELADVVTKRMLAVTGITKSETLIAFQVFSKHDLDSMFAIGFEK